MKKQKQTIKQKRKKRKLKIHRLLLLLLFIFLVAYLLIVGSMQCYRLFFSGNRALEKGDSSQGIVEKIEANETKKIIVIDAGHGGYDTGSVALDGTYEKDLTLLVALQCGEYLKKQRDDVVVLYTRENDDYYWTSDNQQDLFYRVNVAVENDADLFLSIHLNSSDESDQISAHETWVSLTSLENERFAYRVEEALDALGYNECRGIQDEREFPLLVLHYNPVPSVLVELGYSNNAQDFGYISSKEGSQAIAKALGDALLATLDDLSS